ncbi:MAG: 2-oxoacid:acceptor oxidoreductase subunit alpha [bacterium]
MSTKRFSIKITGASGQGINSIGEMLAKALKNNGYKIFAYREYPSLIKGGWSSYQIEISDLELASSEEKCDLLVCLDRESFYHYLPTVDAGGVVVHSLIKLKLNETEPLKSGARINEKKYLEDNKIQIEFIDAIAESKSKWGKGIFANTILTGFIWKLLGEPVAEIESELSTFFKNKPEIIPTNIEALRYGYERTTELKQFKLDFKKDNSWQDSYILSGNHVLALGAIQAGTRAYYSYPMTPATSILEYIAETSHQTGILVKQAEDEITAVQLTIGSMFAGTRAFTATSGGGFDLMSETLSLAGMIETPLVVVLAQRSGPGTGLPTWSGAGDLNLAVNAGHGEFPRLVLAISDVASAFIMMQLAFEFAEAFQIPVIVLTEKQIGESLYNFKKFPLSLPIQRYLLNGEALKTVKSEDRYQITESGISPRWLPGSSEQTYDANSDEHWLDGSDSEIAEQNIQMYEKRMRKLTKLQKQLPEPVLYGNLDAENILVGWGSVKGAVIDALAEIENPEKFAYLHYEFMFPLRTNKLNDLVKKGKKISLIEGNYLGQLGKMLQAEIPELKFTDKLLKFNGRPFFVDELSSYFSSK